MKFVEKKWFKEDKSAKAAAKAAKDDSESDDDSAAAAAAAAAKKAGKVYTPRFARELCVFLHEQSHLSCLYGCERSPKKWSLTMMGMFFKVKWKW